MTKRIEDYGFVSNMLSCALIGRDGSVDWLCLPRFDSEACFAALLGNEANGHWRIHPADEPARVSRCYRPGTMILETTFETATGVATLVDFMPLAADEEHVDLFRIVRGVRPALRIRLRDPVGAAHRFRPARRQRPRRGGATHARRAEERGLPHALRV
jgi:GH15 family glucan-1,4-alpha-glucosidase